MHAPLAIMVEEQGGFCSLAYSRSGYRVTRRQKAGRPWGHQQGSRTGENRPW
jgi:hypothetical protein